MKNFHYHYVFKNAVTEGKVVILEIDTFCEPQDNDKNNPILC